MEWLTALLDPALAQLLPALGTALGSLLAWAVWSALGLIKNQKIKGLAEQAVAFAEQRINSNSEKLEFAKKFLKKRLGNSMDDEDLDAFVEQAVLQMKKGLKSKPKRKRKPSSNK